MTFNRYVLNVMDDRVPTRSFVYASSNSRDYINSQIKCILADPELKAHDYIVVSDINTQKIVYRSDDGWIDGASQK